MWIYGVLPSFEFHHNFMSGCSTFGEIFRNHELIVRSSLVFEAESLILMTMHDEMVESFCKLQSFDARIGLHYCS